MGIKQEKVAGEKRRGESWTAVGFLTPLLLFITALILAPVSGTLFGSFFLDVPFLAKKFIAFGNYRALFQDPAFWQSLRFTCYFVGISVPLEVVLGLLVALILNERLPCRGLFRAAVLIPWAIPTAVCGKIFELIYNYHYGAANFLLLNLRVTHTPVNWLGSEGGAFLALVAADAWKATPFAAIILLAGLSSIPGELYEQARVDRATLLQRFFLITLPILKPVLIVVFLFRTIQALQIFDVVYVLTRGGPGGSTASLSLFAYQYFASGDFGYGAAAGVLLFFLALGLSLAYIKLGGFARRGA
jgi:multiple sugar transport system permease protein